MLLRGLLLMVVSKCTQFVQPPRTCAAHAQRLLFVAVCVLSVCVSIDAAVGDLAQVVGGHAEICCGTPPCAPQPSCDFFESQGMYGVAVLG